MDTPTALGRAAELLVKSELSTGRGGLAFLHGQSFTRPLAGTSGVDLPDGYALGRTGAKLAREY